MDMKRIAAIYVELDSMQVELVQDSIHVDAMYLTRTLGICDDYMQKVEDRLGSVLREKDRLEIEIEQKKDLYSARITELMSSDPDVKSGSTGAERESRAKLKLRDLSAEISAHNALVKSLGSLHEMLSRKSKKLTGTIQSVKKQWDANIESAKYLYLSNRETKEESVYTSTGKAGTGSKLWSDPAIQTLRDDHDASHQEKVANNESSLPIIGNDGGLTENPVDFLKDL